MKIQRITGVNGENERAARGLQLTRVVPPSFSVPFWESKGPAFFIDFKRINKALGAAVEMKIPLCGPLACGDCT